MKAQEKVWDLWVRVFHWGLFSLIVAAFLFAEGYLTAHALAGYVVLYLVSGRVVWGFIGPVHARFSDFIYPLRTTFGFLRDMVHLRHARFMGHNPAAGMMVLLLILFVSLTAGTGLVAYGMNEAAGPLSLLAAHSWKWGDAVEEVHGFFAWATLGLVALHVGAAIFESIYFRENLVLSMINGYKKKQA